MGWLDQWNIGNTGAGTGGGVGATSDPEVISSLSPTNSIGWGWGIAGPVGGAPGSAPGANVAAMLPFTVTRSYAAVTMFLYNGDTVSGNVDLGIYDGAGNRQARVGGVAQAGVGTVQVATLSGGGVTLQPGTLYYMAVVFDNGVSLVRGMNAFAAVDARSAGLRTVAAAYPLPASVTIAAPSIPLLPIIGVSRRASF